jgi:hypothetical protein
MQTRRANPRGFPYPRDPPVPIPIPARTHTREHGYGFYVDVGAGRGRVTHGLPVTCTRLIQPSLLPLLYLQPL